MKTNSNTILITGGASGIGLSLASRFLALDNQVIICGRRLEKLKEAKSKHPGLHIIECDLSQESERIALFSKTTRDFPNLNILFNNAGIQRYPKLIVPESWKDIDQEIQINLGAPIHLSMLFAEHLSKQKFSTILMTTSGLAHVPAAFAPVYSATKAALHSFTLSLRLQLSKKGVEVIEVSPPIVDTDLGVSNTHTMGISTDEFCDAVIDGLQSGRMEITHGFSTQSANSSRDERDLMFLQLNSRFNKA